MLEHEARWDAARVPQRRNRLPTFLSNELSCKSLFLRNLCASHMRSARQPDGRQDETGPQTIVAPAGMENGHFLLITQNYTVRLLELSAADSAPACARDWRGKFLASSVTEKTEKTTLPHGTSLTSVSESFKNLRRLRYTTFRRIFGRAEFPARPNLRWDAALRDLLIQPEP